MTITQTILHSAAILALSGSAYGFVVAHAGVQANEAITPSSGIFVNYDGGAFLGQGSLVLGDSGMWENYGATIEGTTWLAMDRYGAGWPGVPGTPLYYDFGPPAPSTPANFPEIRSTTGVYTGTGVHGVDHGILSDIGTDFGSAILGGVDGITWGVDAVSAVSPLNGLSVDAIFVGNFVLTDSAAMLTGADLEARIDSADMLIPLDGTPATSGYRLEYEVGVMDLPPSIGGQGRQLRMYIVAPSPGTVSVLGLVVLGSARRRRREVAR